MQRTCANLAEGRDDVHHGNGANFVGLAVSQQPTFSLLILIAHCMPLTLLHQLPSQVLADVEGDQDHTPPPGLTCHA